MKEPFVSGCCEGEPCIMCGADAKRKVGEEILPDDPRCNLPIHNLTAYVCLECFNKIMGIRVKSDDIKTDFITQTYVLDATWSNLPGDAMKDIETLWANMEFDDDDYYYAWRQEKDMYQYPAIEELLSENKITECLIHWAL